MVTSWLKLNTPNNRPQLATIRYKMFNKPEIIKPFGEVIYEDTSLLSMATGIELLEKMDKPKVSDISEAEVIIAVGRAFKKEKRLRIVRTTSEKNLMLK